VGAGVLALMVGEFGFYWGHCWSHQIPFFWRFHSIHQEAEEIDWLVNTHAHPIDIVFVSTPAFHHWHHTRDEHINKNYASMLPIMDKLFGTW